MAIVISHILKAARRGARLLPAVAVLLLAAGLAGCSFREPPVLIKLADIPDDGKVCRVVVLPFSNQTEDPEAGVIFARVLTNSLINEGHILVAHEGDTRKVLQQMRIFPGKMPSIEQIRSLADRLGGQIVVTGSVMEFSEGRGLGGRINPSMSVIIRILEADSGRMVWTTFHRREGTQYQKIMHLGVVNNITELARRVADEIIHAWYEGGLVPCEK